MEEFTAGGNGYFESILAEEGCKDTPGILKSLIDDSPLALVAIKPDGSVFLWNPMAECIFGWKKQEVAGIFNPIFPADKKEEFEYILKMVQNGQPVKGVRVKRARKDSTVIDLELTASRLRDGNGDFLGIMTSLEYASDRTSLEDQLFFWRHNWEDTFNQLEEMVTVHDKDYGIIWANKAAERVLGLANLKGPTACYQIYHGRNSPPSRCPSCKASKTLHSTTCEYYEPHLNMFLEVSAVPLLDNKEFMGVVHITKDITERKRSEEKINNQLERLRTLRKIDSAITVSRDLQTVLNIFLEEILSKLNVDAADILLLDTNLMTLEHAASKGFVTDRIKDVKLKAGESCAGHIALEHKSLMAPDINGLKCGWVAGKEYSLPQTCLVAKEGFKAYFGVPLIVKGKIKGVLEIFHRSELRPDSDWLEFLDSLSKLAAIALDNALIFEELQKSNDELTMSYDATIEGWSRALDYRDAETEGHSQRVTEMTLKIARAFGFKEDELLHVRRGALLHDIGKLGVPDGVLLKAGPLSAEEWALMKKHPEIAYELLAPIKYLEKALVIPYFHHEKWDGTGYPIGLKEQQIPLPARIFAVVDVWDALCSDRPYRKGWPKDDVINHISNLAGQHFDPEVVDVFLKIVNGTQ